MATMPDPAYLLERRARPVPEFGRVTTDNPSITFDVWCAQDGIVQPVPRPNALGTLEAAERFADELRARGEGDIQIVRVERSLTAREDRVDQMRHGEPRHRESYECAECAE